MPLTPRRALPLVILAAILACVSTTLPASAQDSVLFTFVSGTGDTAGSLTVTNAGTGSTTTSGIIPHYSPEACAELLSIIAPKVGLRAELSGRSVRIFSRGAIVKAVGATVIKGDAGGS
jgi:hypothetical protein